MQNDFRNFAFCTLHFAFYFRCETAHNIVNLYLIKNIFFNKAPLHDGAMIIRGNRIHACGCFLPLSYNTDIIRNVGTRHRAAIGMSENSDALVVAVSEENGIISIAQGGKLTRNFDKAGLIKELSANLLEPQRTKKRLIPKRPRKETKDE